LFASIGGAVSSFSWFQPLGVLRRSVDVSGISAEAHGWSMSLVSWLA
jgi:hypothetical protein